MKLFGARDMGEDVIQGLLSRSIATDRASRPEDLLRAAIAHSSIAIAVCDQAFTVRFFNPAIGRLVDRAAARSPAPSTMLDGATILGLLGVEHVATTIADIARRGAWQGIVDRPGAGAMHVAVEPFEDAGSTAGWLITAREQGEPTPVATLTERELIARSDKLTAREREVMLALQEGASNKVIALRLGISPRTVEFHRARIMKRFDARSLVDLVRKVADDVRGAR
jgi:FixJ family two-component response regulator